MIAAAAFLLPWRRSPRRGPQAPESPLARGAFARSGCPSRRTAHAGSSSVLPLGAQGSLECAAGVVEPPLHGSGGDSEGSGDGGNRFMPQVVEDEERSFVGIQPVERSA